MDHREYPILITEKRNRKAGRFCYLSGSISFIVISEGFLSSLPPKSLYFSP